MFDLDLFEDTSNRIHMKKLSVNTCSSFMGRTISQSEFRTKDGDIFKKNELYYRLNVRPNKNMTASTFWQTFADKLIYDNECLIIQADDDDLLIADDFQHNQYAVKEDTFTNVTVKNYQFKRMFKQSEVIHIRFTNEKLSKLIDGLFYDYGELFGRILDAQKRKNQIRSVVNIDTNYQSKPGFQEKLQKFINNAYKAILEKDVAIVPQQKGFQYEEVSNNNGTNGQSVEEINKVTNGFLDQVAMAIGIPVSLLHGDMADIEKLTKNYMMYTINPLLKKIEDEANSKFFTKQEVLNGKKLEVRSISYNTIFDIATSIDKLVASGAFTGNEIRMEAGYESSNDPKLDEHYITKNYEKLNSDEGGETNEA